MALTLGVHTTCFGSHPRLSGAPRCGAPGTVPCRGGARGAGAFRLWRRRIEEANALYHTVNAEPDPPPCDPDQHGTAEGQ